MSDTADDEIKIAIGDILKEAGPVSKLIIGAYKHPAPTPQTLNCSQGLNLNQNSLNHVPNSLASRHVMNKMP